MMIDVSIAMWTRNEFIKIWNVIQDFDCETNRLGFPQTDNKTKFWLWVILIINILNWLWINQTGMYAFSESLVQNFSYMFVYIGTCYSVFKFSGMAIVIGQRFKYLNRIARKCSPNEKICTVKSKVDPKVIKFFFIQLQILIIFFFFKMIEKLRDDLMLASEKLNSLHYWSLLLWLLNLSIHAVSGMYFFIDWLIKDIGSTDRSLYYCLVGWLFVHLMQLVLLHSSCDFASTEVHIKN